MHRNSNRRIVEKLEKLYNLEKVRDHLRVSMHAIRSWIHLKKLPVVHVGRRVMVQESILKKIIEHGLDAVG